MTKRTRSHVDDLRGASRLAVDATRSVTDLVEAMHHAIAGRPLSRLTTGPVFATIRGVTRMVGAGIDGALTRLAPLLGGSEPGPERDALLAVLNGVLGDYLAASGNPLAIEMQLVPPALEPRAGGKLLILLHGSCMNERQWTRRGHDHGAALARDLGYTPIYLRYNSGLHISDNGQAFAEKLEALMRTFSAPLGDLVFVAHSMGGLVARSACRAGELAGHGWRRALRKLVCLGTPHHGAPLERAGSWIDVLLGAHRYSAPLARLGKIRSAGVTDMRHGSVLPEHWQGRDRFAFGRDARTPLPLPDGVECYAIAGTLSTSAGGRLRADGIVPVDSALGRHPTPGLTLAFPESHRFVGLGMGHLDLLDHPAVYEKLRGWLSS
jgi:hypothetical protein